jgi:hypothetical protein
MDNNSFVKRPAFDISTGEVPGFSWRLQERTGIFVQTTFARFMNLTLICKKNRRGSLPAIVFVSHYFEGGFPPVDPI